jgi:hypothetical protein
LDALTAATVDGRKVTLDKGGYYRLQNRRYAGVRVPGDGGGHRDVEHVPLDEVENALANLLAEHGAIALEAVTAFLAGIWHWEDLEAAQVSVDQAVQSLNDQQLIDVLGDLLTVHHEA